MADDDGASKAALEILKNRLQHQETLSGALSGLIQTCLRVSFLLNGAAIIAALSVYGAKGTGAAFPKVPLGIALLMWVFGLLATAGSAGFYTWAQRQFHVASGYNANDWANKHFGLGLGADATSAVTTGNCLRVFAIITWWLSLLAFCAGAVTIISSAFLS